MIERPQESFDEPLTFACMAQMTGNLQGLTTFVRVVEAGSFTAGARLLESTPSAVSKTIARLEKRLGTRLFRRSTRALALTSEGSAYYERVAPLLRRLEDATEVLGNERLLGGRIRVSMPAQLGRALLAPITRDFMPSFPAISLEASLTDRRVDLLHDGFDLAIRVGPLEDSGLSVRSLGDLALILVAAPSYLDRTGTPVLAADLTFHQHLRYRLSGASYPLHLPTSQSLVMPEGSFDADDGEALRTAACNGLGIAQLLLGSVREDLREGRLRQVLPDLPLPRVPVSALHGHGRMLPERMRMLVDFIANALRTWEAGSDPA